MDSYDVYLRCYIGPSNGVLPLDNMQNIAGEHAAAATLALYDVKHNNIPRTRREVVSQVESMCAK